MQSGTYDRCTAVGCMNEAITLPSLRPGRDAEPALATIRAQMRGAADGGAWKTARPAMETELGGQRTLRFRPEGNPRGRMILFHGGGYRIGMPEADGPFAEAIAERLGIEVIVPEYCLAPEGPFPAGLVDARAVFDALVAEGGQGPLIIAGDSAGGGLAAALAVLVAAQGGPAINALVLLSPWLDLRVEAPSYAANAATDPLFSRASAEAAAELYLQGSDPRHPLASPLLAPITAWPPTFISVGTGEVLADDSLCFHEKLLAAGARSELCAIDGMEHVAVVRGQALTGSAETFEAIVGFLKDVIQP